MPSLTGLSEEQRQNALKRFRLLQPHLEEGIPLILAAQNAGVPYRTAQRWLAQYEQYGLAGLARRQRTDSGGRRRLSQEMLQLVEGLALQSPPLGPTAIHRQVVALAEQRGEKTPSYSLVYGTVRNLCPALTTLAHRGVKAYGAAFDLVHRREAEGPNQIWQADHTLLDVWVKREGEKPQRPWLTIIIDDFSRAIAGYFLFFGAPSAQQTALALRQAIWRKADPGWQVFGIPEILYTDNGSDFTSQHLEQVAADLKMRLVFSTPGQPRGRGRVERFFETVNQMLLCSLPGYIQDGRVRGEPTLTLTELDQRFLDFLRAYHQRPHRETKVAPQERWQQGGFLPRMADSLEQLDLLLLTVARSRKVHRDGIHFQAMRYIDPTLAAYVGEEVVLRYDPRDLAEVRLFHQEQFLCRAICPELSGETISLSEICRARQRRRRDLRRTLRQREQVVDALLQLKGGEVDEPEKAAETPPRMSDIPPLKRYWNE